MQTHGLSQDLRLALRALRRSPAYTVTAVLTLALAGLLHGTDPRDPAVYATVAALVVVLALLASWVPALRASRADPARALRGD